MKWAIATMLLVIVLTFGFIYLKYNQELPAGKTGAEADALASKMLEALDYDSYTSTNYLEWSFRRNHYKWWKEAGYCEVNWKDYRAVLYFNSSKTSKAYVHNFEVFNDQADELIAKATRMFYNDSFWLVAPYKVFDEGVKRQLVSLPDGSEGLLVTFTQGGSTPGDSYLWIMDKSGRPKEFQMWTSVIPVKGLPATWEDWTKTQSGAWLPGKHRIVFLTTKMGQIKGTR